MTLLIQERQGFGFALLKKVILSPRYYTSLAQKPEGLCLSGLAEYCGSLPETTKKTVASCISYTIRGNLNSPIL